MLNFEELIKAMKERLPDDAACKAENFPLYQTCPDDCPYNINPGCSLKDT